MLRFCLAAVFAVALTTAGAGFTRAGESLAPGTAVAVAFLTPAPGAAVSAGVADLSPAIPAKKAACPGGCDACDCPAGKCPLGCQPAAVQFRADCPDGKCPARTAQPAAGASYLTQPGVRQSAGVHSFDPAAGFVTTAAPTFQEPAAGRVTAGSPRATAGPIRGFLARIRDRFASRRGGGCASCE